MTPTANVARKPRQEAAEGGLGSGDVGEDRTVLRTRPAPSRTPPACGLWWMQHTNGHWEVWVERVGAVQMTGERA